MTTIYVVRASEGEYSEWLVAAYESGASAREHTVLADKRQKELVALWGFHPRKMGPRRDFDSFVAINGQNQYDPERNDCWVEERAYWVEEVELRTSVPESHSNA